MPGGGACWAAAACKKISDANIAAAHLILNIALPPRSIRRGKVQFDLQFLWQGCPCARLDQMESEIGYETGSPDPARICAHHGLAGLAGKCFLKFRHIRNHTVDAILIGRMLLRYCVEAKLFRTLAAAGPLGHSDEKALI